MSELLRDFAAERALLAGVLSRPGSLRGLLAQERLLPEHFANEAHGIAFGALVTIADHGHKPDVLTLGAELERAGGVSDPRQFAAMLAEDLEGGNVQAHARRVRDLHRRRMVKIASQILSEAADEGDADKLAQAEQFLTAPAEGEQSTWSGQELAERFADRLDQPSVERFNWPFSKLDAWTGGGLRRKQIVLIGGWTANGKALDVMTEIPTLNGWKRLLDVHVGDYVFGPDGLPTRVVAETEVQLGRPCHELIFSDGATIVADDEHEWRTVTQAARRSEATALAAPRVSPHSHDQQHKRVRPGIVTTREIVGNLRVESRGGRANHSIPLCQALAYPSQALPIDPYVLGAWLGDGTSRTAAITTVDPEILGFIAAVGHEIRPHSDPTNFGIGGLQRDLRRLGLLQNKHVPDAYLRAGISQRLALLQGLMDTDGHVSQARCEFTSINRSLAAAVHQLTIGLGIRATMIEGRATLNGRDCGPKYRVGFRTTLPVFRLPRKLAELPDDLGSATYRSIVGARPVSPRSVKCIQVERNDGLFLVSRSCITTHNSVIYDQILEHLAAQGLRCHSYINEMSEEERMDRTVARLSGVPFPQVYSRSLTPTQDVNIRMSLPQVSVGITECAGWSAPEIARHIRWNRWDVAGVDIVHEIAHREERDLAEIAQVLRSTAKSVGCALVACVHLNDNRVTTPKRPVPVLRDVRGSGMLVRGADVILFIHRDDDEDGVPTNDGVLLAAKIRNGQPNAMGVTFQPDRMRFLPRATLREAA